MVYKYDYIKEGASVEWQKKVDEIRQRDNYTCQVCGAQDKQVQVHHTWYNQNLHYWEYPNEQLITLCRDCHEKETDLVRRYKEIKSALDTNIVKCFESLMKQGVLLSSVLNVFERMETGNIMSSNNVPQTTVSQSYHPASIPVDEKKQRFLITLQPYESKYDKDYIQTFIDYWLAEKNGKLRFEIDENGNTMNAFGITSDYMKIKLDNWKSKYDIILAERQSAFLLDEYRKMLELIKRDYEENNIEVKCRQINCRQLYDGVYITSDRLYGKLLYDRGLFVKSYDEYDSFLQKKKSISLCCPINSVEEEDNNDYSNFCLLYEAKQAIKRFKDYNRAIMTSIDPQITYKSFCDKYGIKYGSKTKIDKTIKEKVEAMTCPIQIEYYYGEIKVLFRRSSNHDFLLKLNEVFGFQFLIIKGNYSYTANVRVPYKVLYIMDGTQFDFRDDSFENGTMKSIKLPKEYKNASFYVEKIEEMLTRR